MSHTEKSALRGHFRKVRSSLDSERKSSASQKLLEAIEQLLDQPGWVLSFCTTGSEIDLSLVNQRLAELGRLVLPRVEGEQLALYTTRDLILSPWSILEPDPTLSSPVLPEQIGVALVPALAFDGDGHRLGYGLGFYDRLLPKLRHARSIGVGYQEQLFEGHLPTEAHDIPLHALLLL